ncbi:RHS repeat-associated core domain-containing protein [Chryseobacterium camelliae]|uniref:RHS repeat domain-containing protein n=1 Tax=Chryseobacterium camelliae TaxID=1265445 RepID=UPI000C1C9257
MVTDYLDGFQYTISYNGRTSLDFISTSEGYFDFRQNKYIYNYTDHLANVRLSYFNNGSSIEVLEENNYYPFGLKHGGYNELAGNPAYQYKYNGKELQTETGMYDYGARFYMPDIGRWGVVDPLAETSRRWSTYTYAYNNPIRFIDPDGRKPLDWFVNKYTGNVVKIQGVSNLSQLSSSQIEKLGLGNPKAYERLGKDNMFGKDVQYKGMKLGESKFVMLNSESKGFMKENGYVSADRVVVKETLSIQKGRMGSEENITHSQSSLKEISSTKTYVKPEKINTRENEMLKVSNYTFSSVSTATYDYLRYGTDIGQTPQSITNTYFYDNNPQKTSDGENIILQTAKEVINVLSSFLNK